MLAVSVSAILMDLSNRYFDGNFVEMLPKLIVLFGTSVFIFLVGVFDDIRSMPAKWKLAVQILAALVVCSFGIRIDLIPQLNNFNLGWLSWPITVFWIVGITNAVNLIDGLDGLSAGISAATCAVVAAFALFTDQVAMSILMLALLGSLAGFLVFNFNPAKIFMGDSGSMFLGFFLAVSSAVCATKVAALMGLILPALALGLPIFDMLLSVIRRILDRRSVFAADRGHVHHRLLDRGLKHHHVVIVMYLVTLLAAGAGLLMMFLRGRGEVIIFLVALLLLISLFRVAGVLKFRQAWSQVQENVARNREVRRDRKYFETIQNRFQAAWTFEKWWQAVRRMARRMGFSHVTIQYNDRVSNEIQTLEFHREPVGESSGRLMKINIPIEEQEIGGLINVEIAVPIDSPLETIGRRVSLFGRLLDEHSPAELLTVQPPETDKTDSN
jgi:UDP-GlcNAc:undecaprenyl-phosphate GlcNAc-1-phosphate transferase